MQTVTLLDSSTIGLLMDYALHLSNPTNSTTFVKRSGQARSVLLNFYFTHWAVVESCKQEAQRVGDRSQQRAYSSSWCASTYSSAKPASKYCRKGVVPPMHALCTTSNVVAASNAFPPSVPVIEPANGTANDK